MTKVTTTIGVTPGVGANVATLDIDEKKHQAFVNVGPSGHIKGTAPTYVVSTGNQANVAAARTTHFDLFNAVGSGVTLKIHVINIIPTLTAVTGVGLTWEVIKTTSAGNSGTALTPRAFDSSNPSLPAEVTARAKPSSGATADFVLLYVNGTSEETIPYSSLASVLNHVPKTDDSQPIVLHDGEGVKVDQTTNSSVGSTNMVFVITAE
jgi:hypothetical protein